MNGSLTEINKSRLKFFSARHNDADVSLSKSNLKTFVDCNQRSYLFPNNISNKDMLFGCSTDQRLRCLTVSTESFQCKDYNQNMSGSSPLPPALSPVSSSNHSNDHAINQPSSPSPPIIVAEIRGSLSVCSFNSDNLCNEKKFDANTLKINNKVENSACSGITSTSTSFSSSSSSLNEKVSRIDKSVSSLPIFEKMSMVLGSSPQKLLDSSFTNVKNEVRANNLLADGTVNTYLETKSFEETVGQSHVISNAKAVKRITSVARKKRRFKTNRFNEGSDSDFELNKPLASFRGRSDARALIQRVKKTAQSKRYFNSLYYIIYSINY